MLLQRLFCIFGQGLSRRQIVPSVKENEDQTDTSTRLLIKSFKKKFSGEAASWNAAMIERDAISLSDIIRTEEHEAMYKVFADPTRIVILSFRRADCQQPSGGRGKNPHVLSQLHILAGKTLARETVKESNSSDLKVLVDVIAGFADFLLKLERKCHRQQEKKIRTQLSTTQQSSLSHESCVALTVRPKLTLVSYLLSNFPHRLDSYTMRLFYPPPEFAVICYVRPHRCFEKWQHDTHVPGVLLLFRAPVLLTQSALHQHTVKLYQQDESSLASVYCYR